MSGEGSRKDQMKALLKGFYPESQITSRWRKIGDTNLEQFDLTKFKRRMFGTHEQMLSPMATNMIKNGICQAAGFPPAVQCSELMVECAKHNNSKERTIVASNGMVLAHLTEEAIRETFGIPYHDEMIELTKQESEAFFKKACGRCTDHIISDWMNGPKKPQSKIPKKFVYLDFKEEYGDMVFLLNRIMDRPEGATFEIWMFCYVEEISLGLKMINWAKLIGDNLDNQLRELDRTRKF